MKGPWVRVERDMNRKDGLWFLVSSTVASAQTPTLDFISLAELVLPPNPTPRYPTHFKHHSSSKGRGTEDGAR